MVAKKNCPSCRKKLALVAFNGSSRTADGCARICRACTNTRRRQLHRSRKAPPQPTGQAAKTAAALRNGDGKALRALIRAGAKPHWSWVCETMREGHLALAQWLLEFNVENNVYTMAAVADVVTLSRRLRRVPGDAGRAESMEPSSQRVTPLHIACASDWTFHGQDRMAAQVCTVEVLVEHGADVNAVAQYRGIDDASPLLCACWTSRNLALFHWLLDHDAILTGGELMVALGHLQRHGREAYDIAEVLLTRGQSVNGGAPGDRTPLQAFAHQGAHRTVAWLLARGADLNARGPGGRTAAHFAAERNTGPRTLALLVDSGADLTLRDDNGQMPLDVAKLNEKERLVQWIKKRMQVRT